MKSLFNAFAVLVLFAWCVPQTVSGHKAAYLMVYFKEHGHNNMGFSATTDFVHYTDLGHFNQGEMKTTNFSSPKHGAVIQITQKELRRLQKQWKFKL